MNLKFQTSAMLFSSILVFAHVQTSNAQSTQSKILEQHLERISHQCKT